MDNRDGCSQALLAVPQDRNPIRLNQMINYVNRGYNILYLTILINAELTSYDYLQIQHK